MKVQRMYFRLPRVKLLSYHLAIIPLNFIIMSLTKDYYLIYFQKIERYRPAHVLHQDMGLFRHTQIIPQKKNPPSNRPHHLDPQAHPTRGITPSPRRHRKPTFPIRVSIHPRQET